MRPTGPGFQALRIGRPCTRGERLPTGWGGSAGLESAGLEPCRGLTALPPQTGQLEPLLSRFTEEEERQMTRMLQRMDVLAKVEDPGMCRGGGAPVSPGPQTDPLSPPCPSESQRGGRASDGGCRADLLPAGHQPPDAGDAAQVQCGEATHLQHVPVLPQGAPSVCCGETGPQDQLPADPSPGPQTPDRVLKGQEDDEGAFGSPCNVP